MPNFAANLSMLFNELDFMDRFKAAADAGFKGVEYLFPYDYKAEDLAAALKANGLQQVLHNMPPGDWAGGERGIAILPGREDEFRAGVDKAAHYASTLGCPMVNCLAGLAPQGVDRQVLHDTFVKNLRYAAGVLEKAGVKLIVEAINTGDIPGFFLNTSKQAMSLIAEVGSKNLGFQYDIYHMQIMEGNLARTIEANLDLIWHMQLADNPGRHEPGTGEINYPFLFNHIDKIGYKGWIGCEYKPAGKTLDGLGWLPR